MTDGITTILYPVRDIGRARAVFSEFLGVEPDMDESYYVGFNAGDQHIGLDPNGHSKGMTGPVAYRETGDIEGGLKALVDAGAETVQEPRDVGGGKLVASVKDADGNVIGLVQPA